jgi:hypothetical protein
MNLRRSQTLVAAADALIRAARRLQWVPIAGGSDGSDAPPSIVDPRVLRTWTKVKNGALPTDGARRRWVGPGRDAPCNGCGDPIASDDTEYEIDFNNALLLRFHRECLRTWETFDRERR